MLNAELLPSPSLIREELLHLPQHALVFRRRFSGNRREFLEELALAAVQGSRDCDADVDVVIAVAAAVDVGNALAAEPDDVVRLRAGATCAGLIVAVICRVRASAIRASEISRRMGTASRAATV